MGRSSPAARLTPHLLRITLVIGGASFLVMAMGRLAAGMFLGTMEGACGFSIMELAAGRSDRSSGPVGAIIRLKRGGRSLTPPAETSKLSVI